MCLRFIKWTYHFDRLSLKWCRSKLFVNRLVPLIHVTGVCLSFVNEKITIRNKINLDGDHRFCFRTLFILSMILFHEWLVHSIHIQLCEFIGIIHTLHINENSSCCYNLFIFGGITFLPNGGDLIHNIYEPLREIK